MHVEVKVETVIELATCPQDGTIYVVLFDTQRSCTPSCRGNKQT
jgi:hypothetical protein